MRKTKSLTFATDFVTADGKAHEAGAKANVPRDEARELVYRGRARKTSKTPPTTIVPEAPADGEPQENS